MAGKDNLRTPTTEEARERGKKGGQASGKARRRKRELKELLELALSQPSEILVGEDNYTAITAALINRAILGDTKAYEVIRDTLGQKPKDQQQVEMDATIIVDYGDDDE